MISNIDEAKLEIEKNIIDLDKIHNITVGNYMIRVFLDAKADEIVNVFSQGKQSPNQQKMKAVLQAVSPTYENKWEKINQAFSIELRYINSFKILTFILFKELELAYTFINT